MPASLQLYRTISGLLLNAGVRFHDLRCQATFLWAVVGLILEKSVHLGQWSRHHPGETKQASRERRFSRWLHNPKIEALGLYAKLFGCVSFELKDELKVKRVSGKVSLDKPLQEKPHGFQLTVDYTRCARRI